MDLMGTMKVVMDGDPGSDDAIAMLVAIGSPEIELVGITTVGGNAAVADVTDNALRLVSFLGAKTPVYAGSVEPLDGRAAYGSKAFTTPDRRRTQVTGLDLPAVEASRAGEAVDFLIDCFSSSGGEDLTLIATGPLTNLARALDRKPALQKAIPHLILMGGAHDSGNVTASAEFNFWADPVAAKAVFDAHLADVVMFPLDATRSAPLTLADCQRFEAVGGGPGHFVAELIRQRIAEGAQAGSDGNSCPVHDLLCIAQVLEPVIVQSERCFVEVEADGSLTRGRSVIDTRPWRRGEGDVTVAWKANAWVVAGVVEAALRQLAAPAS
jgi:inosine-uridine nucleoside N-ribohydrolase